MSADFSKALEAATAAAGQQHYPQATLYVVATPIGNLADISLRALHVLQLVDAIACEDTRHTAGLLRVYGIDKPLLAVHEHNEREAAQQVITRLQAGARIAYVSDAGTPAVSDPGARLVDAVRSAGLRVMPLPGASSVTTLLSSAGIVTENNAFCFDGFLSTKAKERETQVSLIAASPSAHVLLEAPHRIASLAQSLATLGARLLTIGRELTKQFEEIATLPADQLSVWLAADAHRTQGEFALVIHPAPQSATDEAISPETDRVLKLLLAELPTKAAVKLAAEITHTPRNALYERALQLKQDT
jgi:16S rRNA (cytidine1402-2'-O)-methyltransferase